MQSLARFNAIQSNAELSQKFGKNGFSTQLSYMYPNCIIDISNEIYFVYQFLCNIIHQKPKSVHPKKYGKLVTTAPTFVRFSLKSWLTPIYFRLTLSIKFHEIARISSWATLVTNFLSHKQSYADTDRQMFSGHLKTYEFIFHKKLIYMLKNSMPKNGFPCLKTLILLVV